MDKDLKRFIAGQLYAFRRATGLNQAELAERIDRTAEAISNIERGKSLPALDTLMAISQALAVPIREFFSDQGFDDDKSPNRLRLEAEAQAVIRGLSDERAKIALAQLKALATAEGSEAPFRRRRRSGLMGGVERHCCRAMLVQGKGPFPMAKPMETAISTVDKKIS